MSHYLGEILLVPYNFVPKECILCDGRLIPITMNPALFSLLGTTFGGDGKATFALPNYDPSAPAAQNTLSSIRAFSRHRSDEQASRERFGALRIFDN